MPRSGEVKRTLAEELQTYIEEEYESAQDAMNEDPHVLEDHQEDLIRLAHDMADTSPARILAPNVHYDGLE